MANPAEELKKMHRRLQEAARTNNIDELWNLRASNPEILHDAALPYWENPVSIAVKRHNLAFIKICLRLNPDLAGQPDKHGYSPYHWAAAANHNPIMKVLLSLENHGIYCLAKDGESRIPLQVAAAKGNVGVLGMLIRACPESARALTDKGQTFLHLAVESNCPHTVKAAVEELRRVDQTELLNLADNEGNTAVHLAVSKKQVQTLEFLLTNSTSSSAAKQVNTKNNKGFTALDLLIESPRASCDREILGILLCAGAATDGDLENHKTPNLFQQALRRTSKAVLLGWSLETRNILLMITTAFAILFFQVLQQHDEAILNMGDLGATCCSDVVRRPRRLLPVLHLIVNTVGFVGTMSAIPMIIWSLPLRDLFLFVWFTVFLCYGFTMAQIMPRFVIKCLGFHIPSFWFVWLGAEIMIIFACALKLILIVLNRFVP